MKLLEDNRGNISRPWCMQGFSGEYPKSTDNNNKDIVNLANLECSAQQRK